MDKVVKLLVGIPTTHEQGMLKALGDAGAGRIGNYDFCSFVVRGTGHFRPLTGTKPFIGEEGEVAAVDEVQVQTVCYEKDLPKVLEAMRAAHPYEEIAYDIVPLLNHEYDKYVGKRVLGRGEGEVEEDVEDDA